MTRRPARPPTSALALLQHEVNQLFQRLTLLDRSEHLPGGEWCPPVDIYETRGCLVVVMEVPGLSPESLKVAFRDHSLVIAGRRRTPRPGAGVSFQCLERPDGRFQRVLPLDMPMTRRSVPLQRTDECPPGLEEIDGRIVEDEIIKQPRDAEAELAALAPAPEEVS